MSASTPVGEPAPPQTSQDEAHSLPDLGEIANSRVAGTAVADLGARIATVALGIVTTALLARHLGASGFATFAYALAWGQLFAPLTDFGLSQAAVNRLSVRDLPPSEIAGSLVMMRFLMSIVFAIVAASLAVATAPDSTVATASLVVCFGMILGTPGSLMAVVRTAMKPGWTIISNVSNSLVWAVVAVILIRAGAGPVALVAGVVGAGLSSSLIQAGMARRLVAIGRPTKAALMSLLRLSLPLGLAAIAATVYYRIDSILLYQISGSDEAGYYAAAYRLVDQVQIIPIALIGAVFPLISQAAAHNPERLRRLVAVAWELLLGFALPIVALGMAVAHPLIGLLFGEDFQGPTGTVLILIWPVVLAIFLGYLGGALVPALDLVRIWIAIAVAGAVLNVIANLILIPPFGANGAAIATVATEFPVMIVTLWIAVRRANLKLPLGRVTRMFIAAAVAGVVAAIACRVMPAPLVSGLAAGVVAYGLGLRVLGVVEFGQIGRALRDPKGTVNSF